MTRYIILFIITSIVSCKTANYNATSSCKFDNKYKIKRVKKINNSTGGGDVYLIHAERNDSIFKILTSCEHDAKSTELDKIKIGNEYMLELKKIYPIDTIVNTHIAPNLGIKGMIYYGKRINIQKSSHNSIYFTNDINGIYIVR